jgi:PIN domain nuclease of toxin-antitoxin system
VGVEPYRARTSDEARHRGAQRTVQRSLALADHHLGDPADRFLAATAEVYELTLVTADERLLRGKGFRTLANR